MSHYLFNTASRSTIMRMFGPVPLDQWAKVLVAVGKELQIMKADRDAASAEQS